MWCRTSACFGGGAGTLCWCTPKLRERQCKVVRILGETDDGQIVNEWAPLGSMILGCWQASSSHFTETECEARQDERQHAEQCRAV